MTKKVKKGGDTKIDVSGDVKIKRKKGKKGSGELKQALDAISRFPMNNQPAETIIDRGLAEFSEDALRLYGSYVVEDRAVPDFRDGLKPVHRSLLWSLAGLGLRPDKGYKKAARTVGDCFVAGTLVDTDKGKIAIEDLKVGDHVFNDRGKFEVEELFEMPPKPLMRVTVGTREVECTETQIFFVQLDDGTIVERFAKDLKPGDRVGVKRANT